MELGSAHNYKPKQQMQPALIEHVKMLLQLTELHHLIQQHQDAKLIYPHAFGMEI